MPEPAVRVAVFGEVNMNLIDGSSVWLQSLCLVLAARADTEVKLLLRASEERDLLTRPLHAHERITLVEPGISGPAVRLLSPAAALERLGWMDTTLPFDVVVLRGVQSGDLACRQDAFPGRLWLYYLPPADKDPADDLDRLRRWAAHADRLLLQTAATLEAVAAVLGPGVRDRLIVLPPMIPDAPRTQLAASGDHDPRRLVYAGKFAPEYCFFEQLTLLERLRAREPGAELHLIGDKVHDPPQVPGFRAAAQRALAQTPGVVWHGALTRAEVAAVLRSADVALSLRDASLDRSHELSTKVLEYGAAGVPVLLNRTAAHERLLGVDYPLFADNVEEALAALENVRREPATGTKAARRAFEASRRFTFERVAQDISPHVGPRPSPQPAQGPRLLVAAHQHHFFEPIARQLEAEGVVVRRDTWLKHDVHVPAQSEAALKWAQVILCEWCLGNARWYAEHRGPDQRLLLRFHRMELETDYPVGLDIDQFDSVVFVADHVRATACERFGWDLGTRSVVIPNVIDFDTVSRPKLPDAEFNLGMVGFVPSLKRLDRALDVLERLRMADDRYRLLLKGLQPWQFEGLLRKDSEREYFELAYVRMRRSPLLCGAVTIEPFGGDVATFLQKVGSVLSLSDIEGHSVALAEGMASRAVPFILERPGVHDDYPGEWIHASPAAIARAVLAMAASGTRQAEGELAREYASRWRWDALARAWAQVFSWTKNVPLESIRADPR